MMQRNLGKCMLIYEKILILKVKLISIKDRNYQGVSR